MSSQQPKWKCIANIGDVSLCYGPKLVYVDKTGVYPPELHIIEPPPDDNKKVKYTIYRFTLDKCTNVKGILSDNRFHPEYAAWFAKPESEKVNRPQDTTYLSGVCSYCGIEESEMISMLCSEDVIQRAQGYLNVAEYHGYENFDSYPLRLTSAEASRRFGPTLRALNKKEH